MAYISMSAPADSFSLLLENTTNQKRSIELFQLGLTNSFTPIETTIARDSFLGGNSFFSTGAWEALREQFVVGNLNNTSSENNLVQVPTGEVWRLTLTDTLGNAFFVDFPDTFTGNFLDYNGELQNIVDTMVGAGLTPACQLRFTFNGEIDQPIPVAGGQFSADCYGLFMQSESPTTNIASIRIQETTSGLPNGLFNGINTWYANTQQSVDLANGVIISAGSGIPYKEIERSQNGAFLDIRGISVQVLTSSGSSIFTQNAQNLNSLGFYKINPNGDDYSTFLNPTIDPYQSQNVVQDLDMDESEGLFVLDGNTRFDYDINPFTKVDLTFDYVQFPNFLLKYGYKVAEAIIDIRQAREDMINYVNNFARNIELDIKEEDFKKAVKMLDYAKQVKK